MSRKIIIFLIILFLTFVVFLLFRFFKINKVVIYSEKKFDLMGMGKLNNQNLLLINTKNIEKSLLADNPKILSISSEKNFPNTLKILIIFRKPIAKIDKHINLYLDKEGYLLFEEEEKNLPLIEFLQGGVNFGKIPDWRLQKIGKLLDEVTKRSILVDRMIVDDVKSEFVIFLREGTTVLLPYTIQETKLAPSLQTIISRFRIEGKIISKIDFRHEKPIVVLANEEKSSSSL